MQHILYSFHAIHTGNRHVSFKMIFLLYLPMHMHVCLNVFEILTLDEE